MGIFPTARGSGLLEQLNCQRNHDLVQTQTKEERRVGVFGRGSPEYAGGQQLGSVKQPRCRKPSLQESAVRRA